MHMELYKYQIEDNTEIIMKQCAQVALLGRIPQNLRAVSIEQIKKEIVIYCIFDGEPCENEERLMNDMIHNFNSIMLEGYKASLKIQSVPAPQKMDHKTHLLYWRHEGWL